MDISKLEIAEETVTVTLADGTTKVYSAVPHDLDADVEVDIITASGEKKTFVAKAS